MKKNKLRILYIMPQITGGMIHYCSQLINMMSKYHYVMVIGPKLNSHHYYNDDVHYLDILNIASKNPFNYLSYIKLYIIKYIQPDVIHITLNHPVINLFILLTKLVQKYPVVYTCHDPQIHIDNKKIEALSNVLSKYIKYDKYIVHTNNLKNILIKKGIDENSIKVIPHGLYQLFHKYRNDKKIYSSDSENVILFFGRIRSYKGIEYLIKAIPLVTKYIPNIKVIIAGEGNFKKYRELISNKSYFEIYNYYIPDKLVHLLFERAKIVVFPYLEASQSGPLHIAFSFKKAVIATNVGGISEVIKHKENGYLIPPRNEKELAQAIITLLNDKHQRNRIGNNAFKQFDNLSWSDIAQLTSDVYKNVLKK